MYVYMYIVYKKKTKKNCDLLPLGSLILETELSPSLFFLRANLGKEKGEGEGNVGYYIQDVFFWRLAGLVAPTGKAIVIVHWIGY